MASIILSAAGSAVGGSVGGTLGASLGLQAGRMLGGALDAQIFGVPNTNIEGPRLSDLTVQTSTYGKTIPIVFGSARIAGNVIWSQPIREEQTTSTSSVGGGKGGGGATVTNTSFSYYVTLAIAICEGPIDRVLRVWADAKLLDLSKGTYRFYKGDEAQLPDPALESSEGIGKTPAYRGLAYVVIENFPLGDFGNRIPNFTFEVKRTLRPVDVDDKAVEEMITGVNMIPGSGEFVYDTQAAYKVDGYYAGSLFASTGLRTVLNAHNHSGQANALLSLDQLQETLPNCEWVGVVGGWFGTSIDAGSCVIRPGVEYSYEADTEPSQWSVAGYTRLNAYLISKDVEGNLNYGGTPDDASLVRYLTEVRSRGLKVFFIPMFFMDLPDKPWRGRVTGSASDVASFFTKTDGYNAFVLHYATLLKDVVDAFAIGSELIGLTKVSSGTGVYPAVDALVSLAASVKAIVGSGVNVTYCADWSEYHHTDGGWYNLDTLWASPNIDVVGIDAYFPLADGKQSNYDVQNVVDGWFEGEGYDWYYTDAERTTKAPLSAPYAWKNIDWWWRNSHTNPDSNPSAWVPESKPIWFTEYGFPSVDNAINQPNVFYDPESSESGFPRFSEGNIDFLAQRQGIAGTEKAWENSEVVEQKFVWTWDARPFPYWPDLRNVWADGNQWQYGHWINGKLGLSNLGEIIKIIALRTGMDASDLDVSRLRDMVDGFVITRRMRARDAIALLQAAYFFDLVESDGVLKAVERGDAHQLSVDTDQLVPVNVAHGTTDFEVTRMAELELPKSVDVVFFDKVAEYLPAVRSAIRETISNEEKVTLDLPLVLTAQQAQHVADGRLYEGWVQRLRYRFRLPMRYVELEPTDVIEINTKEGMSHRLRIQQCWIGKPGVIECEAVAANAGVYDRAASESDDRLTPSVISPEQVTELQLLDLPCLPGQELFRPTLHMAATGRSQNWRGVVLYRSDDGSDYRVLHQTGSNAIQGKALTAVGQGVHTVEDVTNSVEVSLFGSGALSCVASELVFLNGGNAALLGDEVVQFRTAELLSQGRYRLSGLLRGRLGTEWAMSSHTIGERFVLLDGGVSTINMAPGSIGASAEHRAVTVGETLNSTEAFSYAFEASGLKPYAPVSLSVSREDGDDIMIRWIRRSRGGVIWADWVDVPLNEASERYEVELLDSGEVVRTIETTSPQAVYPEPDQLDDFGTLPSTLELRVYQISEMIGRGYPLSATVTL